MLIRKIKNFRVQISKEEQLVASTTHPRKPRTADTRDVTKFSREKSEPAKVNKTDDFVSEISAPGSPRKFVPKTR